jgi:hypothetical protein
VRWQYIPADVHAHAHVMATAASSAQEIACSCASEPAQPHEHPYPSLTQVYIPTYICIIHTYIHIYIYTYIHIYTYINTHIYPVFRTRSYTYARGRPHMRVPTRLRAHTRAHIGGASAHNGPRRTDHPPGASRLRWRAARAGKAAHTS